MLNVCPACNAENRDIARFCDQCGSPIAEDAIAAAKPAAKSEEHKAAAGPKVNWAGLALLFVLLGVGGFLLFPAKKDNAGAPMMGGAAGEEVMGKVLEQVGALKKRIETDPTDTKALNEVYTLYQQVGKIEKAREYVQLSLDGIQKQIDEKKLDTEKAVSITADVAQAAVMAGDGEGAMMALEFFHKLKPDDVQVLPFLGNLAYDLGKTDDAIKWYSQYLEQADPATSSDYWNVQIDRSTMYLQKADDTKDGSWTDKARVELEAVVTAKPEMFNAWFNLGQVHLHKKDKVKAREMFAKALTLSSDEISKYKAEKEIALIDGKEPPAMPNPHGEGGSLEEMGLGPAKPGVENPHGEGFGSGGGMSNPHGEGFGDVAPGVENPHGEGFGDAASPHGENPHGEGGA
ncbi:tetratricopeptide repeat protein [bacterium]|nr:tetratricopeptide repeat protein [bacterium]